MKINPRLNTILWATTLAALVSGSLYRHHCCVQPTAQSPQTVLTARPDKRATAVQYFDPRKANLFQLPGLQLSTPVGGVKEEKTIVGKVLATGEVPPLGDLVNVTKGEGAYRLLPHGKHFTKEAKLRIAYDPALIPEGYTADNIRTYFFDTQKDGWVELPLDTILTNEQVVVSRTDHFTDFINGIIQAPETEKTTTFESNSIKGIKANEAGTNIDAIEEPKASPMGTPKMSLPIRLPMPRDGVGPALSFDFALGSGSGSWMGQDWNLSLPFIGIDTRWGVPRYSSAMETETYLLNGAQLWPVAHRGWFPRSAEKQFWQRVEGSFMKIVRHGDNPKNYWWELTDKNGTRYFYGGSGDGLNNNAVLKDDQGNIAHWALCEVRDANDNYCRYTYTHVQDAGMSSGKVMGGQLYPNAIFYTGHKNTDAMYSVRFLRDRQLNEKRRADVEINCRLGFKRVTADLLSRVNVYFQGGMIRSYELNYKEGAFHKTLLSAIIANDKTGAEFFRHEFDYYDDVRKGLSYQPYGEEKPWDVPFDNVTGDIPKQDNEYNSTASLLSTSKSLFSNFVAALTFGWNDGNLGSKSNTLGGNFGDSDASSEGIATLIDINGDGLPDKVFKQNGRLYYRPNLGAAKQFGTKREIKGIRDFNRSVTSGSTSGFEAMPLVLFIGTQDSESETTTSTYFTDFNGDGLVDVAHDGKVYFNRLDAQGDPEFLPTSIGTPNPVADFVLNPNIFQIDPARQDVLIKKHPLHDVVRMWEAPYDGIVSVSAPVQLLKDALGANDPKADGVRVSIQQGGSKLFDIPIKNNDFTSKNAEFTGIKVKKGQRIYFRVQSVLHGKYDVVQWDPLITYEDVPAAELDANARLVHRFQSSEDFLLASPQVLTMPLKGRIKIDGTFAKPATSDDVCAEIVRIHGKDTIIVYEKWFDWDKAANQPIELGDIQMDSSDALMFRVKAYTNVDWSLVAWMPSFHYTSADNGTQVLDPQGKPVWVSCPAVGFSMYNDVRLRTPIWTAPESGTATFSPSLPFKLPWNLGGRVTLSVKGVNNLYARDTFYVTKGRTFPQNIGLKAQINKDEPLYIEYHIADPELADSLFAFGAPQARCSFGILNNYTVKTGLFVGRPEEELLFGPLYRGWGQFAYNGNLDRADKPILENDLKLDSALIGNADKVKGITDPSQLNGLYDPASAKFVLMVSDPKTGTWRGFDNLTFLTKNQISSSRLGKDDILLINPVNPANGANAPYKIAQSESSGIAGSISLPIPIISLSLSGNQSDGTSKSVFDNPDMNGDKIPDPVTEKFVQYSQPTGALEQQIAAISLGSHAGKSTAWGYSAGGGAGYTSPKQSNSGEQSGPGAAKISVCVGAATERAATNATDAGKTGTASAGLSISVGAGRGGGEDQTAFTLLDINGDGLPDRLYEKDTVALNLGYRFAAKEVWGHAFIREGKNKDKSNSFGLNIGAAGGSAQGGTSWSNTQNQATRALQDVNGDGLVDALYAGNPMRVQFNTGSGFGPFTNWPGAVILDEGASIGQSFNFAFTTCLPVFFGIFKFCVNPAASSGNGLSRQLNQFMDVDGDGFNDWLSSENDGELFVRSSTIARTNMLKTVRRPMGASFVLDYERQPNTYAMPHAAWTLKSVETRDGLLGDGPDYTKTLFAFEGGYYDRREREFYGYQQVTTTELDTKDQDKPYRSVVQTFHNDQYHTKGLMKSEVLKDAQGRVFRETTQHYELRNITTGTALPSTFDPNAASAAFPALAQSWQYAYEGQTSANLQTTQTYSYDVFGNVTVFGDLGDGSPDNFVQANIQYHFLPSKYIFAPKSIEVATSNGLARKRQSDIDQNGNVVQIRQFTGTGDPAVMDFEYYPNGNLKKLTRPKNHRGQRLTYEYEYDAMVGIYLTRTKDGYGYESTKKYDYAFGQLLESTDLNGQQMRYTIDDKGRIETITGPYEIKAGKPYTIAFDYHPDAPVPYARTRHFDPETGGDIETYTFSDGLMRPLQVKKTGSFFVGDGKADEKGMIVSGRTLFDAFGRTIKTWHPMREGTGKKAQFNPDFDGIKPAETEYDILDRPLRNTLPDGAITTNEYQLAPDNSGLLCLKTTTTDPKGNAKAAFTDAKGRKRAVMDNGPNGEIWTEFRYNGLSELLEVTDDADHKTMYTYDLLGRKRTVDHPDAGLTEWRYDPAGNIVEKISAELRLRIPVDGAIRYTYDHERLIQVDYPKNFQNQVKYTYGAPKALFNRAGRVVLVEDGSGGEEFYYGPLGETVKSLRTVLVNKATVLNFITKYEYDTWNRIQKLTYPDGETVDYTYNAAGKLYSMSGLKLDSTYRYVVQLGYDKFEQRQFLRYGNGTVTNYQYEPERRRLGQMDVTLPSGKRIMNNLYEYDAVDNVLSVTNSAPAIEQYQLGGPTKHQYQYDNLYRLIGAQGTWTGFNRRETYDLRMEYSNTHDILRKTQTHLRDSAKVAHTTYDHIYRYDGTGAAHAPSKIGRLDYRYDENGNQIGWNDQSSFQNRQCLYNEDNLPVYIWDNGYQSIYTYDAAGNRLVKSHGPVEASFIDGAPAAFIAHTNNYTAYPNAYLTARRNGFVKHYFVEGQRILSKNGSGYFEDIPLAAHKKVSAGQKDYIKKMHQLEDAATQYYMSLGGGPNHPTLYGLGQQPEFTGKGIPALSTGSYTLAPAGFPNLPVGRPDPTGAPQHPVWVEKPIAHDDLQPGFNFVGKNLNSKFLHEHNLYFFHPDHLGSTSYVTGKNGEVRQHLEYMPFGESFVDEYLPDILQPWRFNGKEHDEETGLTNFGARLLDSRTGIWNRPDPMAEKYPGWSSYNFALQNPVKYVDPDGRQATLSFASKNSYVSTLVEKDKMKEQKRAQLSQLLSKTAFNGNIFDMIAIVQGYSLLNDIEEGIENPVSKAMDKLLKGRICGDSKLCDLILDFGIGDAGHWSDQLFLIDPKSGKAYDTRTGFEINKLGELIDTKGNKMDRRTQLPLRQISDRPYLPGTNIDLQDTGNGIYEAIDYYTNKPIVDKEGNKLQFKFD